MNAGPGLRFAALLAAVPGCIREELSRTGYETLQNIGRHQCLDDPSAECPERTGHEEYRRRRAADLQPARD